MFCLQQHQQILQHRNLKVCHKFVVYAWLTLIWKHVNEKIFANNQIELTIIFSVNCVSLAVFRNKTF